MQLPRVIDVSFQDRSLRHFTESEIAFIQMILAYRISRKALIVRDKSRLNNCMLPACILEWMLGKFTFKEFLAGYQKDG